MAVRRVARRPVFPAAADYFSNWFQGPVNGRKSRAQDRPQTRDSVAFPGVPNGTLQLPDTAVSCADWRGRQGRSTAGAHVGPV